VTIKNVSNCDHLKSRRFAICDALADSQQSLFVDLDIGAFYSNDQLNLQILAHSRWCEKFSRGNLSRKSENFHPKFFSEAQLTLHQIFTYSIKNTFFYLTII